MSKFTSETAKIAGAKGKRGSAKVTRDRKEKIIWVLDHIEEKYLDDDIAKLKPSERVHIWNDLHEYVIPKLQRTEFRGEIDHNINILPYNNLFPRNLRNEA